MGKEKTLARLDSLAEARKAIDKPGEVKNG